MTYAKVSVRHVGGDLLVARRDKLDPGARAVERVQHPDAAATANAEHVWTFVGDQRLGGQVGALHACHVAIHVWCVRGSVEHPSAHFSSSDSAVAPKDWLRASATA